MHMCNIGYLLTVGPPLIVVSFHPLETKFIAI